MRVTALMATTLPTYAVVRVDVVRGEELGAKGGLAHLGRPQHQHPAQSLYTIKYWVFYRDFFNLFCKLQESLCGARLF